MSVFKPLDNQIHPYRKRKQISLDGTAGGLSSPRTHGGYRYPGSEFVTPGHRPLGHTQYLGPWPHDYEPNPGRMESSAPEYEAYEGQRVFHATTPPLAAGAGWIEVPVPEETTLEEIETPSYNDCRMTRALSREAWQQALASPSDVEPTSVNGHLEAEDVVDSPTSLEQIIEQEMALLPLQEIENALEQQISQAMTPLEPELPDPFEMQQMHEQQMQQLMDPFGMMGPGPMM